MQCQGPIGLYQSQGVFTGETRPRGNAAQRQGRQDPDPELRDASERAIRHRLAARGRFMGTLYAGATIHARRELPRHRVAARAAEARRRLVLVRAQTRALVRPAG